VVWPLPYTQLLTHHNDRVKPLASIYIGCLNIKNSASINVVTVTVTNGYSLKEDLLVRTDNEDDLHFCEVGSRFFTFQFG